MTERDPYPSEKQDRFIVRLPDGMRDRIKAAAAENNRSMNAEIVATLEEKYPRPILDDPNELLNEIRERFRTADPDERLEILNEVLGVVFDVLKAGNATQDEIDEQLTIMSDFFSGRKLDDPRLPLRIEIVKD